MKNVKTTPALAAILFFVVLSSASFAADNSVTVIMTKQKALLPAQPFFGAAVSINRETPVFAAPSRMNIAVEGRRPLMSAFFAAPSENSLTVIMAKPKPAVTQGASFAANIIVSRPHISIAESGSPGAVNVFVKQPSMTVLEPSPINVNVAVKQPSIILSEPSPINVNIAVKGPIIAVQESKPLSASLSAEIRQLQPRIAERPLSGGIAMSTNFQPSFGAPARADVSISVPTRSLPQSSFGISLSMPYRDMDRDFDP